MNVATIAMAAAVAGLLIAGSFHVRPEADAAQQRADCLALHEKAPELLSDDDRFALQDCLLNGRMRDADFTSY